MRRKRERRVLVEITVRRRVAVDPDRARVDNAGDLRPTGGLEDHLRAVDVDATGADRVGEHVAYIRHRSEMDDGITPPHGAPGRLAFGEVADDGLHRVHAVIPRRREVEDDGLVAVPAEPVDDVRSDEARSARDENLHADAARSDGMASGR